MNRSTLTCISTGALLALGTTASATTLTFGGLGLASGSLLPLNLGSEAFAPGNGYVEGDGWTPDVSVVMETLTPAGNPLPSALRYWAGNYGDLTDVAYPASNGNYASITLTGGNGFLVSLNSFDLAGYPQTNLTASRIRVLNGFTGAEVWNSANLVVNGSASSHSTYTPNLIGGAFTIEFGDNWNIGIDNINFTQTTVPEPATMAFLSLGAVALLKRRRKS